MYAFLFEEILEAKFRIKKFEKNCLKIWWFRFFFVPLQRK